MTEQTDREQQIVADIKEELTREIAKFEEAKADFLKRFEANPVDAIEWRATNMIDAQTRMRLARETLDWIERATSENLEIEAKFYSDAAPPETEMERVLAGLKRAKLEFTHEVMGGRFYPTSTCPVRNLVEAAESKVTAEFAGGKYNGTLDSLIMYAETYINYLAKQDAEAKQAA